jgi:diguanylate cyclase (GGDEF)-like protein
MLLDKKLKYNKFRQFETSKSKVVLQKLQKKFQNLLLTETQGVLITDLRGKCLFANSQAMDLLNLGDTELVGSYIFEFCEPGWDAQFWSIWQELQRTGEVESNLKFSRRTKGKITITIKAIGNFLPGMNLVLLSKSPARSRTYKKQKQISALELFPNPAALSTPKFSYEYQQSDEGLTFIKLLATDVLHYDPREVDARGIKLIPKITDFATALRIRQDNRNLINLEDEEILRAKYHVKNSRGDWRWIECETKVLDRRANQVPRMLLTTLKDITNSKKNQPLSGLEEYDSLTGLPNRRFFEEYLQLKLHSTSSEKPGFAVLLLDIDRFKFLNASFQESGGDEVLKIFAYKLQLATQDKQVVLARAGDDEFAVLLENPGSVGEVMKIVQEIQEHLSFPIFVENFEISLTCSVGIVMAGRKYTNADQVLRDGAMAMNQAKQKGKGQYAIFDQNMYNHNLHLFELEADLRRAVKWQEFEVFYQPIVAIENRSVVGCEALVRWQHKDKGLIVPSEFITLAEETGLVLSVDKLVLQRAALQNAIWQSLGLAKINVAVNLSAKTFADGGITEYLSECLSINGIKSEYLDLEITEGVILENTEHVLNTMQKIRSMGMQISIDDFGMGYSSLTYLHSLPINTLKIDQSFVRKLPSDKKSFAVVKAIITMAKDLGIKLIAEGVETVEQLECLGKLGCDHVQGYLFGKPQTAQEFESRLRAMG